MKGGLGIEKAWQGMFTDPARNRDALARFNSEMAASRSGTGIIANKWYDAKKHYFTDPKLNRMRELFLAGNLKQLFKEFPRGAPSEKGVNTIKGGRLIAADMPGVDPGSAEAKKAWDFWTRNNATGQPISLSKMNVKRSGNNIVPARKIPNSVIHDFYDNYLIFDSKWICAPPQIEEYKNGLYSGYGDTTGGIYEMEPVNVCRPPPPSKIKAGLMTVAMIVAFYYLGPMVAQGFGAATGGVVGTGAGTAAGGAAGATAGTAASGAAQATWFAKFQTTANTFLSYVNNARTIKAIVDGEMPPPPISITGASFREWATIVAKKELKDAAIEKALEMGTEYVAKKMTEKEEAKLRKEIAEMQKQLIAMTPKEVINAPPEPSPLLAAPLRKIQQIEIDKKAQSDKTLETLLAVSIPAILILKGA